MNGEAFVAHVDRLSERFGADKVIVEQVAKRGDVVVEKITAPGHSERVLVDWSEASQ